MTPTKVPIERREVAVEGVRFVIDRAEPSRHRRTTPVLLLHGVPETRAMWRPLLTELGRDRIAIAPDLKGLGESEACAPYDVPTLVRELVALALHEVDGRVDLVGHDWGGSLALSLAVARPDLVRRLVVINAPFRYIDFTHAWHIPLFALPAVPDAIFAVGGRGLVGWMLDHGSVKPIDARLREQYIDAYANRERVVAMLAYYRAAVRNRLMRAARGVVQQASGAGSDTPERRPISPPEQTLVIWGAEDPALPLPVGEAVVRDIGTSARLVTLPGVGHFTVDEAPDQVTELVSTFLREEAVERAPA
ncbi:MAG: alpha/beta fold hydrolase [Actinomycetes bacterium]